MDKSAGFNRKVSIICKVASMLCDLITRIAGLHCYIGHTSLYEYCYESSAFFKIVSKSCKPFIFSKSLQQYTVENIKKDLIFIEINGRIPKIQ